MKYLKNRWLFGWTIIELMIVVAIIGIIAAVAYPAYQGSIRQSYLNEATSSISSIKQAEESFYSINKCYIEATPWPTSIPAGITTAWGSPTGAWASNALGVRPDRNVHFQYRVYASNALQGGGCGGTPTMTLSSTDIDCAPNIQNTIAPSGGPYATNWYIVNARGNLSGTSSGGLTSNIISGIDDSTVFMCNSLF